MAHEAKHKDDLGEPYPKAPPPPPSEVWLRNKETGEVARYDRQNAREILAIPNTIYEPAEKFDEILRPLLKPEGA